MKKRLVLVSLICILLAALALPVLMAPDNPLPAVPPEIAVAEASALTSPQLAIVQQDEGILTTLANDSSSVALLSIAASVALATIFVMTTRQRRTKSTANLESRVQGFSALAGIV